MESLRIIEQLIDNIPEGEYQLKMKPVIRVPEGSYYAAVEGSRGEFGVYLESRGDKSPYRLKFSSTGLPLVSCMDTITRGAKIADLIAIGGTLDYVVHEQQNTTILVVTHDSKIVQEHKKRTILIENGCVNADTSLGGYDI